MIQQVLQKTTFLSILLMSLLINACTAQSEKIHVLPNENHTETLVTDTQSIKDNLNNNSLPDPDLKGEMSLEEALANRRSVRSFKDTPLTPDQIGQLLWAAQGITHPTGYRTAPSAGALYPLEVYATTQDGLFHYDPAAHSLVEILSDDPRPALYQAALEQEPIREAPLVIIITGVFGRTAIKYGESRSPQYVHLEAGHAAQNILLQAVALGLGAVPIGAFQDSQVKEALSLPSDHIPFYLIPVGSPKNNG